MFPIYSDFSVAFRITSFLDDDSIVTHNYENYCKII